MMNTSKKSGFVSTLTGLATVGLLVTGCAAMEDQSSMHKSSAQDSMKNSAMGMHSMAANRFGGPD